MSLAPCRRCLGKGYRSSTGGPRTIPCSCAKGMKIRLEQMKAWPDMSEELKPPIPTNIFVFMVEVGVGLVSELEGHYVHLVHGSITFTEGIHNATIFLEDVRKELYASNPYLLENITLVAREFMPV